MSAQRDKAHTAANRLVLAHGFAQNSRCWADIHQTLAASGDVACPDLAGHGPSPYLVADLWEAGDRLVAEHGSATYIGYSMGARICLHAALSNPTAVQRLVLISGTAGIVDDEERSQRRASDNELADSLALDGLERFIDRWLAQPIFRSLPTSAQQREQRLHNTAAGLASSLRTCGTGTQDPLWERLGDLMMPVLIITGERDPKFTALATTMATLIGTNATHMVIADAGHSVHLEQPQACTSELSSWLNTHP